jgi:hypothetical protein
MSMMEQRAIQATVLSTLSTNIHVPIWLGLTVNLGTVALLTFGDGGSYLAITVLVLCVNLISIIALMGSIDDWGAWIKDQDEETKATHAGKVNNSVPLGLYKIIAVSVFASLAISQLYMMHWA